MKKTNEQKLFDLYFVTQSPPEAWSWETFEVLTGYADVPKNLRPGDYLIGVDYNWDKKPFSVKGFTQNHFSWVQIL
jgi:hypothetical protein